MMSETFDWSTESWPAFVSEGPSRWYLRDSCSVEGRVVMVLGAGRDKVR